MTQKNIIVPKTARYFILGESSENIEQVWFVCHGYGELAKYFIKHFDVLDNGKTLVIAPEALNRFYRQGFSGKVGASWMTSEDRESDITDYVNYLNLVYTEVLSTLKNKKVKINVLGFSQAGATVCRWVANHKIDVTNLILWSGNFAHDIYFEKEKDFFNSLNITIVMGEQDEFFTKEVVDEHINFLTAKGINAKLLYFKGKHQIHKETLLELAKQF